MMHSYDMCQLICHCLADCHVNRLRIAGCNAQTISLWHGTIILAHNLKVISVRTQMATKRLAQNRNLSAGQLAEWVGTSVISEVMQKLPKNFMSGYKP